MSDHTDPDWLREHYLKKNLSQKEIGAMCGVTRDAVDKQLRDHGITKPRLLRNLNQGTDDYESAVKRDLKPVTDESVVIMQSSRSGAARRFHAYADGEPACGTPAKRDQDTTSARDPDPETNPDVWTVEEAKQWAMPCRYCYLYSTPGETSEAPGGDD